MELTEGDAVRASEPDALRPRTWDQFVGQTDVKDELDVRIAAAIQRQQMLRHVLLIGPPGFGKTSLSSLIAYQLGDEFSSLTMPVKPAVFASHLRQFAGVLLLDEIHRSSKSQQEDLLTLLEDGYLQLGNGRRINCWGLTVIGATTEPEKIIPPLYDRFPIQPEFVDYSDEEMAKIIQGMARLLKPEPLDLSDELCEQLGKASAGTPRNGRSLVFAAQDLTSSGREVTFEAILKMSSTDTDGLNAKHLLLLKTLDGLGGQAGLQVLSSLMRLHPNVITDLERTLVHKGLLMYGDRGRELTALAYRKIRPDAASYRRRVPVPVSA